MTEENRPFDKNTKTTLKLKPLCFHDPKLNHTEQHSHKSKTCEQNALFDIY